MRRKERNNATEGPDIFQWRGQVNHQTKPEKAFQLLPFPFRTSSVLVPQKTQKSSIFSMKTADLPLHLHLT